MFGNTACWPLQRGRLLIAAIGSLLGTAVLPAGSASQEVRQAAQHLGPTEDAASTGDRSLQWQRHPARAEQQAERTTRRTPRDAQPGPPEPSHQPTAARDARWQGTLVRNPDATEDDPAYMIVDHLGVKQRYVRTQDDIDLERFLDREVTVLADTGLILDLDQIELGNGPRRVQTAGHVDDPRRVDRAVEAAAYDEPAPRFRPGDPTVRSRNTTNQEQAPHGDRQDTQQEPVAGEARVAQRIEELPLSLPTGQPLPSGENILAQTIPGSGGLCPTCGKQHASSGCVCGARGRFWGRAEYLYWWTHGFDLPPLVTTSSAGTPQAQAGVLGQPNTSLLFGGDEVLDDPFHGARFRAGYWMRGIDKLGFEGDYLGLIQDSFRFSIFGNNGSPIIARPFFNALIGAEDASLVAFPNLIEGTVTVDGASDLEMAGLRLRIAACCNDLPTFGNATSRVDFLAGYRFAQLDEQLFIVEDSTSLDPDDPGSFLVSDAFITHNEFHGGEAGVVWEVDRPRWTFELLGRIAVGSNQQDVVIAGSTTVSDDGFSLTQPGGLLAQRTNSGHFERNRLSVIPELSATVAFKVTQRLRLTAGYTFLYWTRVVRPGPQIDLDVNPNLFPPEADPFTGPLRPQFAWRETDFWAHGVSAGIDYRF